MRFGRERFMSLAGLVLIALALAGCMRHSPAAQLPVSVPTPSGSSLDQIAYGASVVNDQDVVDARAMSYAGEEGPYRLDSGDKLRIVVFGQEGLTNTYQVDAGGAVTLPLIGAIRAKGSTTAELSRAIAAKLKQGYIREPHVAAEIDTYRPFFILGEVTAPGQYPFVPNMSVQSAVAIAGGFSARAKRNGAELSRTTPEGTFRAQVPVTTLLRPGDTIVIGERWF